MGISFFRHVVKIVMNKSDSCNGKVKKKSLNKMAVVKKFFYIGRFNT